MTARAAVAGWGRPAVALLLLAGTGAAAQPRLPGIQGADDRRIVDSRSYPWSAIGRVNRETGGHCTGTLIAPDAVLTAAHCVWNRRTGRWTRPESLHFLAGYSRGAWLAHAQVTAVRLPDGVGDRPGGPARDWAVLRLAEPIGRELGTVALGEADDGATRVLRAGYSQDKPHILTVHRDCRMLGPAPEAGLVQHTCDATRGDSGSAILARAADGHYRLVALHVAAYRDASAGLAVPAARIRAGLDQP